MQGVKLERSQIKFVFRVELKNKQKNQKRTASLISNNLYNIDAKFVSNLPEETYRSTFLAAESKLAPRLESL